MDLNGFEKNLDRFFVAKRKTLYCADRYFQIAVKWNGESWERVAYDEIYKCKKDVTPAEASTMAAYPPWDLFTAIEKQMADDEANYWEPLIASTQKKVIGYTNTAYGSSEFLPVEAGDITHEEYAAIVKDFRENGYFFSGEEYQDSCYDCTPVLENYRYVDFSRRGFGALIARSQSDYSLMGYSNYTEEACFDSEEVRYPLGGRKRDLKKGAKRIEINKHTADVFCEEIAAKSEKMIFVRVPETEKGFYWSGDKVFLTCGEETFEGIVKGVMIFCDVAEFEDFRERRRLNCSAWENEFASATVLMLKQYTSKGKKASK